MSTSPRAALRAWLVSGRPPRPADEAQAAALVDAAVSQGVAGLLHEAVHADRDWPPRASQALQATRRAWLWRGARQLDLAERTRATLAAQGLRSLPLKGAALSELLYTTPAERPMADVDLLVLDDWDAARRVLAGDGFIAEEHADHACSLRAPESGLLVELHRGLASCPRLHPIDVEGLWARALRADGHVRLRPAPEDLLVQLALHAAFQHGLVLSLVQWLDVRRLLEREALDPRRLAAAATHARAQDALALTLAVAATVVSAPVAPAARARTRLDRWLAPRLDRPLDFVTPSRPALARVRWGLAHGRRHQLLADTLWPAGSEPTTASVWDRAARGAARGAGLAWRSWRPFWRRSLPETGQMSDSRTKRPC